jgi:predicted enzyme related to lactoylglutathione lyase
MGRLVHFEVHVDDMERAKTFYGEVFGWKFEEIGLIMQEFHILVL